MYHVLIIDDDCRTDPNVSRIIYNKMDLLWTLKNSPVTAIARVRNKMSSVLLDVMIAYMDGFKR